jgi:hypothetical protein
MSPPTREEIRAARRRLFRYAATLGVGLGLVCNSLPPQYQALCNTISTITSSCNGN